jgi:hypothetical protein
MDANVVGSRHSSPNGDLLDQIGKDYGLNHGQCSPILTLALQVSVRSAAFVFEALHGEAERCGIDGH